MKTTFDNIEYIIKKLVEYQVKSWVSDVRYDGTTKLLPLHPLSVAKHIAYDCGWSKRDFGGRDKEISAHMRPYNHIKELSQSVAREIISCLDDDTFYYAGSPRYVLDENGEKVRKTVSQYFDAGTLLISSTNVRVWILKQANTKKLPKNVTLGIIKKNVRKTMNASVAVK